MRKVLIIDDDRIVRLEVNKVLTSADYKVLEASGPLDGIERAKREQPDLILLDVLMPGMDGISVLRQLRDDPALRDIPVIVVTSCGSEAQVAACLEEGAIDHITKPFSHRLLCARVSAGIWKRTMSAFVDELNASPAAARADQATLVAFLGAKGGVGTTTLAANAACVAALNKKAVILCEMRPTFGSLSLQFNAQPRGHLGALAKAADGLSDVDWDDYLVRDSSGLRILFGPQADDGDIRLEAAQARQIIEALQPCAHLIFLDLAAGLTDFNREMLKLCDRVVLVLDCEPTSVGASSLILDQLQQTSIRHSIKAVVVKRTELSMPPKIDAVQASLGCDLIGVVPPGADALARAAKTGATLVALQPDNLVAAAIRRLTEEHLLESSKGPVVPIAPEMSSAAARGVPPVA